MLTNLGQNLLLAVIGAALAWAVGATIRKFKRYRLEKKYPIAGYYISEFEDIIKNEKTFIKSPLQLKQHGRSIKGITEFDGRTWILDGEISDDGYLFGIYHAESVHDKGIGNFFLEVNINSDMEGLWSGYDSANKKIVSGRYLFTRIPSYKINHITKNHVPAVLNIAEKQLGNAYINADDLIDKNNVSVFASIKGDIVGFCTSKVITLETLYKDIPQLAAKKIKQLDTIENLGLIASVATDPKISGRGIGSALVEYCIKELEKKSLNVIVMTGWKGKIGIHIGSIANNHGFENLIEVQDFWKEDSINKEYSCPSCGDPPCHCSAVVYVRHAQH